MRLLFLVPRYHSNMLPFIAALKATGVAVRMLVVGRGKSEDHEALVPDQVPMCRLQPFLRVPGARTADFALYAMRAMPRLLPLYRYMAAYRPDYVVCRGLTPIYILCALPYVLGFSRLVVYTQGPRIAKRTLVGRMRNNVVLFLSRGRWYTPVLRRGPPVIGEVDDNRVSYIPFSMRVDQRAVGRTWCREGLRLLAVGKFVPRKNHERLVRALACVRNENVTLTIVGEVSNEEHRSIHAQLQSLVASSGLGRRVRLVQNVPHSGMPSVYLEHDLCLQVSSDESASVSQLEAMACGLGVIVEQGNGTASYVEEGVNGCSAPQSVTELGALIEALSFDPARVSGWGRASLARVEHEHSPEVQVRRFFEMLGS